jgi:glycosyltransferase involved in cell wall biosynthesis
MRFSVDAHAIGCHLTGNEVYIRNLLRELARLDQDSDLVAYISKPGAPEHVPERVTTRWVSENPYKRLGWDIPRHLDQDRPDLLHVQYTGPLRCRVPLVVSVHDVSYLEHPEYFTRFRAAQLKLTVRHTVERAASILTPSEFSKTAILRHYGVSDDRVRVVPNAVSAAFRPVDRDHARAAVEKRLGVTGPFVLTVGDLQPRKNHLGLLRAFETAMRAHPKLRHKLLCVGKETWYSPRLREAVRHSPMAQRVHFTGFVEDAELVTFYGACELFVYPSLYEGFGLPILEAMACGRAVACSNSTAMPEVADSAALLFNPRDTDEMASAIGDVLTEPGLRARLERLGQKHAANFSWKQAAEQTLNAYYEVCGAGPRFEAALKAAGVL